jgi:hypothetical protein
VTAVSATPDVNSSTAPAAQRRRHRSGFWAAAFAFLIVMAVATLPSPLYGLYRTRDHLSAFTITVVFAIFAASTIAVLQRDSSLAVRLGRRGTMLGAVATMMVAVGVLAAWKDLPGLLIGRLIPSQWLGRSRTETMRHGPTHRPSAHRAGGLQHSPVVASWPSAGSGSPSWLPWRLDVAALLGHLGRAPVAAPHRQQGDGDDEAGRPADHQDNSYDLQVHVLGRPGDSEAENRADDDQCRASADSHERLPSRSRHPSPGRRVAAP